MSEDSRAPQVPSRQDDLRPRIRVQRELRAAAVARRSRARQAVAARPHARRRLAALCQPARLLRQHVCPSRQESSCSWAARWHSTTSGVTIARWTGTLLDYAPHQGVQTAGRRPQRRRDRATPALYERDFSEDGFEWIDWEDRDNSVLAWVRRDHHGGLCGLRCRTLRPWFATITALGVPEVAAIVPGALEYGQRPLRRQRHRQRLAGTRSSRKRTR